MTALGTEGSLPHLDGIELYQAVSAVPSPSGEKHLDPVCGMEMTEAEVTARLTLDGVDHRFCSDTCLRKFVAAPEHYGS